MENDILEDFLKTYYRKNVLPKEIILENDLKNKEELEKFFSKEANFKVNILIPKKSSNKKLIELANKNLDEEINFNLESEIKNKLNLKFLPNTIECFDMSNLAYKYLVGAMVRFSKQKKDKSNFRRYEIKSFNNKNDDYLSFREVIFRRYVKNSNLSDIEIGRVLKILNLKNLKGFSKKIIELPNLIVCDGGVGQLNSTIEVLKLLKLYEKVDVISLAKKDEIIYKYEDENLKEFKIDKNSKLMIYIRNIRDSVHNFVKSYNIKKRKLI